MKSIIIFIVSVMFFAFLAWLGGYNFDQRDGGVAAYFAVAFTLSLIAIPLIKNHEDI